MWDTEAIRLAFLTLLFRGFCLNPPFYFQNLREILFCKFNNFSHKLFERENFEYHLTDFHFFRNNNPPPFHPLSFVTGAHSFLKRISSCLPFCVTSPYIKTFKSSWWSYVIYMIVILVRSICYKFPSIVV